ncbi:GNAT family N-acetyltransferase [Synechococcus sp. CS-1329]|jgi:[ribosomal protein S18]-alanine N-acetyltransferase|uniref:GNAT family N-acetyltransferase n=1 Tax=Synechococcus sp. CS-1329 TaxID=2847975 RepID=UPI00223C059A|nr:GNAT family N-acetyltransferase [Synechococcus sp. CS-1329]MCT0218488.1 GNAT family N-acetyltransferase [Synechococcus sp. CS-1329]
MSLEAAGPGEFKTRRLGPDHAEACHQLDRLCRPQGWALNQWHQELEAQELAAGERWVLGVLGGSQLLAVGSGWLILDELQILLVLVHPTRRRTGLARRLMGELMHQGQERGASAASLEVAAGNIAALGLYASLGFRNTGRRRGYYRDGQDALIQWCQLKGCAGSFSPY